MIVTIVLALFVALFKPFTGLAPLGHHILGVVSSSPLASGFSEHLVSLTSPAALCCWEAVSHFSCLWAPWQAVM